jgi:hypothetical protein
VFFLEVLRSHQEKPRKGRPAYLNAEQCQQLSAFIKKEAESPSAGRLVGSDIHDYIVKHFDKHYHPNSIYYPLDHMDFSWITSRSKHPKQSQQIQNNFKKFQIETILKIPSHIRLESVDVWFQDDARFGQQNTTTRLWGTRGARPRVVIPYMDPLLLQEII